MIRAGLATLAGTVLAMCAAAQSQTSTPQNPQTPGQPNAAAQAEASGSALANGTAINAELSSTVDSKKAKVGDKVEAKATEAVKNGSETIVPKGAKLIGHVTEASARSKGDNDSTLAIQFDKALPKNGQEIPLNGVLVMAVAPPSQSMIAGGAPGPGSEPTGSAGGSPSGGSPMGGSRSQSPTGTSSPSSTNYPTATASGSSSGAMGAAGPLPPESRGVYGLKDLKLMMSNSKTNPGTVITSTGKNVHLDGGTRLLLIAQAGTSAPAPGQ